MLIQSWFLFFFLCLLNHSNLQILKQKSAVTKLKQKNASSTILYINWYRIDILSSDFLPQLTNNLCAKHPVSQICYTFKCCSVCHYCFYFCSTPLCQPDFMYQTADMIIAALFQEKYPGKRMLALSIAQCSPQIHNGQLAEWMCVTVSLYHQPWFQASRGLC